MKTDELAVGKKIPCELSVHYRGKNSADAFVKVYLDNVNITSFPLFFEKSGTVKSDFFFRVETEKKHYMEFVIKTAGEVRDTNLNNNRLSITFRVPGEPPKFVEPVRPKAPMQVQMPAAEFQRQASEPVPSLEKNLNETIRPLAFSENAMRNALPEFGKPQASKKSLNDRMVPEQVFEEEKKVMDEEQLAREKAALEKKLAEAKKEFVRQTIIQMEQKPENAASEIANIEEGNQDFGFSDEMVYFEQPQSPDIDQLPKDDTTPLSEGKPVIDLFFIGDSAFRVYPQEGYGMKSAAWKLLLSSSGVGEADIEIVVASGGKKIVSQKIHIRGGESLELPMQATFERTGSHKLTAMINTLNNVVDRNLENNIVETRINVG